jgi:putative ABC transport system permease protein
MVTQYQGFVDINMGVGIVIFGLGSVMISNSLLDVFKIYKIHYRLMGVVIGAIIFRLILAFSLSIGLDPVLLKLITACVVLLVVSLPILKRNNQ